MPLNKPEKPGRLNFSKFQKLALGSLLGASVCGETRQSATHILQEQDQPAPGSEAVKSPPKILLADENVSEGLLSMAELAPGRSWLGKMEGNGGRGVMLYLPEHFDYKEPYELIYFFHGTGSHEVRPPEADLSGENFGDYLAGRQDEPCIGTRALNQVLGASERAQDEGRNQAVVYPLSAGSRGTGKNQDLQWMRAGNSSGDDIFTLNREAREALESMGVTADVLQMTLKGHSAGGAALNNLLVSAYPVDRVDYLDASYWEYGKYGLRQAYKTAIEANPDMEINIFVHYPGKTTDKRSRAVVNKPGVARIDARGKDWEGHHIVHGKMMRNYWNWQR